jgi:hypothetical protein
VRQCGGQCKIQNYECKSEEAGSNAKFKIMNAKGGDGMASFEWLEVI